MEEKQIGEVDLFEPTLEDNQFRLTAEEAVLKKSIAIVDTGLSVEKENIQDMNKSFPVYSIFTFKSKIAFTFTSKIAVYCIFTFTSKIVVCFLWLSLPGDYRVTDEALLAETT